MRSKYPNARLQTRESIALPRNATILGVAVGLASGLWRCTTLGWDPLGGLVFGLIVGLIFASTKGGGAFCVQHLIVRLMLWRRGVASWYYVRFLDYAADLIFLRKVGGGYIFVHRMLMEYFAAQYRPQRS